MKFLLATCVLLLVWIVSSFGQQAPLALKNVTSVELAKLNPTTGTMVYNITEDAIYYYGNDGWFALSGECVPKPVSPNIDSAFVDDNQLFVFFSPVNSLLNYVVEEGGTGLLGTVNSSPAVFDIIDFPRSITVRAKSKCGSSGPLQMFPVENRDGH